MAVVGRQESRVDERLEHFGAACRPRRGGRAVGAAIVTEDRQQLVAIERGARALRRHQVAKQLADDRHAILSDALERRFGMLRQRAANAADRAGRPLA